MAHALTARVKDLERSLIASLKELRGALLPALPEPGPASEMPQPAAAEALTPALAAVHANPDGARRLRALLDRVQQDVRFGPLARGVPRCADFEDCARDFVLDVLLSKVRAALRKEHGFPRAGKKMGIPCVFSPEPPVFPKADGTVCASRSEAGEQAGSMKLNCEWGFGAATHVTGAFGFAAAGEVVRRLAAVN